MTSSMFYEKNGNPFKITFFTPNELFGYIGTTYSESSKPSYSSDILYYHTHSSQCDCYKFYSTSSKDANLNYINGSGSLIVDTNKSFTLEKDNKTFSLKFISASEPSLNFNAIENIFNFKDETGSYSIPLPKTADITTLKIKSNNTSNITGTNVTGSCYYSYSTNITVEKYTNKKIKELSNIKIF